MHAAEVRVVYVATLTDAEVLQSWAQQKPQNRLDYAWETNVSPAECRVREQVRCPHSSMKAWVPTIPYHFCRRANSKPLWNTFHSHIHLSFHCSLEIHLQISVAVEVKKQAASSSDAMNFRGVKKGGLGSAYWIFSVYLRAQFIKGGLHMPYCFPYSFHSKSHPTAPATF